MEPVEGGANAAKPAIAPNQLRHGTWFNIGLGYGLLGCKACDGTTGGLTGGLVLGGTLSPRLLLGLGTTAWTKSESGATLTVGTLDARIRFYPSATGGFFLTAGLGLGTVSAGVAGVGSGSETGLGAVVGIGMDFNMSGNLSLTPFWNGFAGKPMQPPHWSIQIFYLCMNMASERGLPTW